MNWLCDRMNKESSTYNLFSLYAKTANSENGIYIHDFDKFKVFENRGSAWPPNIAYDFYEEDLNSELITSIEYEMNTLGLHPFLICELKTGDLEIFGKHGFRPIEQWHEMHRSHLELLGNQGQPEEIETFLIKDHEIESWTDIVSRVLFKGKALDHTAFKSLKDKGARMAGLKVAGKWAGTSMAYMDDRGGAGIYMVCINNEFRGRGFAKWLINICFGEIKKSGINRCFLQSTKSGINLYNSLNFQKTGNYYLYWKMR